MATQSSSSPGDRIGVIGSGLGGLGVEVEDHFHVVADETDGGEHHLTRPLPHGADDEVGVDARRQSARFAQGVIDEIRRRLEPRCSQQDGFGDRGLCVFAR